MDIKQIKKDLANEFGMPLIGTCDYFNNKKEAANNTARLIELYDMLKNLVREHDKLADSTGNSDMRINGKRGRKAETEQVSTVDDVLAKLG